MSSSKDFAKSLNASLGRHFSRLPKHLHEQVSNPSEWIPHNTPVGIFYVNNSGALCSTSIIPFVSTDPKIEYK